MLGKGRIFAGIIFGVGMRYELVGMKFNLFLIIKSPQSNSDRNYTNPFTKEWNLQLNK